jgi:hypothetical protein
LPSGFLLLGDKDMYPSPSDFEWKIYDPW